MLASDDASGQMDEGMHRVDARALEVDACGRGGGIRRRAHRVGARARWLE
jgi:hypothetical protein